MMKRITLLLMATLAGVLFISAQEPTRVRFRVSVSDPSGRSVTGLKPENFRVRENGVERNVVSATLSDEPASVVIMIDVSDSFNKYMRREAVALITKGINELRSDSDYLAFAFGEKTYPLVGWGATRSQLKTTLAEVAEISTRGERSFLYDSLAAAISKADSGSHSRKLLIVASDGYDQGSKLGLKEIKKELMRSELTICALALAFQGSYEDTYGIETLKELVEITGGIRSFGKPDYYGQEFPDQLRSLLQSEYVISWESAITKTDANWRKVKIEVAVPELKKKGSDLKVLYREGYFPDALRVEK